ncbi:MAG: hypothetical protein D6732_22910 [Methanobacteriota archaeon]|nr:MAG: hypothetical protein D6732_22910 [Euryarchaeota archaeon]
MNDNDKFEKWINVLKRLGDYDPSEVFDKRGKITDFNGKIKSSQDREVNLGVMFLPWRRSLGVNKINQVARKSKSAGLDGAIIVTNKYSPAAEDQVNRINEVDNVKVVLFNTKELELISNAIREESSFQE